MIRIAVCLCIYYIIAGIVSFLLAGIPFEIVIYSTQLISGKPRTIDGGYRRMYFSPPRFLEDLSGLWLECTVVGKATNYILCIDIKHKNHHFAAS